MTTTGLMRYNKMYWTKKDIENKVLCNSNLMKGYKSQSVGYGGEFQIK